jgi:hypothetical protein
VYLTILNGTVGIPCGFDTEMFYVPIGLIIDFTVLYICMCTTIDIDTCSSVTSPAIVICCTIGDVTVGQGFKADSMLSIPISLTVRDCAIGTTNEMDTTFSSVVGMYIQDGGSGGVQHQDTFYVDILHCYIIAGNQS